MNIKNEKKIYIRNFRNLKDLKFKFLEGKMNVILGKNNVGKSNLLDYVNSWYIKNGDYEIFYLKEGEKFAKYLSSPIIFEVKKVLLISLREKKEFEWCNEHYFFEIESLIFGIKRNVILTKCRRPLFCCSLKDYRELFLNKKETNFLEQPMLIKELEEIFREGTYFLFDKILERVKTLSADNFGGLGELLSHHEKQNKKSISFKFKFCFLDQWDGKKKQIGIGMQKIIFLYLLLDSLENKDENLILSSKTDRKWNHKKWVFFFLSPFKQKSVLLIDKPETFLHPSHEREIFLSLKRLADVRGNCDVIITTNSSEFLTTFPSEIYDGNLNVAILDQQKINFTRITYLKKLINKIKEPILRTFAEYDFTFRKRLEKRDSFYRDKWIEILSRENTSKLFFSNKVLFVEGSTEAIFFSSFIINLLLERLKKKFNEELKEWDKAVENNSLSEEEKKKADEEQKIRSILITQRRDEYKKYYLDFINEKEIWKNFNEIKVVPIFGKINYIFFAKLSENLWLEHKFLLDNDRKIREKSQNEVSCWKNFYDMLRNEQKESWRGNEDSFTTVQEAQKIWNEGWDWPFDKFFYDLASYCDTNKRNNCYCNNITWIEDQFEKFIDLEKKENEFGKTPEANILENISNIIENLIISKGAKSIRKEKWRIILNLILEKWKWGDYLLCKWKEIENKSNE